MGESSVISIDERLVRILESVGPIEPLDVTLQEARGCLVAEDMRTTQAMPHFTSCSTAGFAARSADCNEGARLVVVDRADPAGGDTSDNKADPAGGDTSDNKADPAGGDTSDNKADPAGGDTSDNKADPAGGDVPSAEPDLAIELAEAVEVQVGGVLPEGTDVVIPHDAVESDEDHIDLLRSIQPGEGVSLEGSVAGEDVLLIPGNSLIDDRSVGVLAAMGLSRVGVVPRPRVVIVSVGNDLVPDTAQTDPRRSHDTNGSLLGAAAAAAGAVSYRVAPIADNPELVAQSLDDQLIRADVIVVCGAVSQPSDTIREVLERIGDVSYDEGSTSLGVFGTGFLGEEGTHLISLPRDPVAAYLLFRLLVDPIIAGMLGFRIPELRTAELAVDMPLAPEETQIKLASSDDQGRLLPAATESPTLIDLRESDAVIKVLPGTGTQAAGSTVPVLPLVVRSEPA